MHHECAHHVCHCQVSAAGEFCGDVCRTMAGTTTGVAEALDMRVCTCGHSACLQHEQHEQTG